MTTLSPPANATALPGTTEIQRGGYVALSSPDPAAAAGFAVRNMGLSLVHVDGDGRHYLAAHGLDPYSLVYVPGERGLDHFSYVVDDAAALERAEHRLRAAGAEPERVDPNPLWRADAALRLRSPAGHVVHLTPGVHVDVPMAALVTPTAPAPAPISVDHVAPRTTDPEAEGAFCERVLGLRETARVVAPDGSPAIVFFRTHTLFHCYTLVPGPAAGLHHFQFTLKNGPAVLAAHERIAQLGEAEIIWGPLRHGPGHNIAFYFREHDGHFVEFSAEEEVVLDSAGYVPQVWSTDNPRFLDEWGSVPPAVFFE